MLVSIIIPLYNKEFNIKETLESVLQQTYLHYEIVVINDGSTDNSFEIVNSIKDSRIKIFSQENKGVSSARNLGIEKANGDYISFLDADDYWFPNHLEEIVNFIKIKRHLKVFTSLMLVETKHRLFKANYSFKECKLFSEVNFFKSSYKRTILSISNSIFKKEIFEIIGNFNINYKNGEDTDLFIRIGFKYKIGLVQKYTTVYKYVENSLTNKRFSMHNRYNFDDCIKEEVFNKFAKKMFDINRYSLAMKCKLVDDVNNYHDLLNKIDLKNLSIKQKILLKSPKLILKLLLSIKKALEFLKINPSAF